MYDWEIWYFNTYYNTWTRERIFHGTPTEAWELVNELNNKYETRMYEAERLDTETAII